MIRGGKGMLVMKAVPKRSWLAGVPDEGLIMP